jgi:hypothetical protein
VFGNSWYLLTVTVGAAFQAISVSKFTISYVNAHWRKFGEELIEAFGGKFYGMSLSLILSLLYLQQM